MIPMSKMYENSAPIPCDSTMTVLDMTADTQYLLMWLVLVMGLTMLYLYFKINSTLKKTSETLSEIDDLFDTLD